MPVCFGNRLAMLKAEWSKQGLVEPEDLFARLRMLNSLDKLLRQSRHPPMAWRSPTPLEEEATQATMATIKWASELELTWSISVVEESKIGGL